MEPSLPQRLQGEFFIDDWHVQPTLHRISGPPGTIQVEPKAMEVLLCLAAQPQQVVSRDDLMRQVWPETYVVEATLSRCISELRKAFEDDPKRPSVIETIRTSGYRLLQPVRLAAVKGRALPSSGQAPLTPARPLQTLRARLMRWAGVGLLIGAGGWYGYQTLLPSPPEPSLPLHPIPLTSQPGPEYEPALSPDGHQLAYAWDGEQGISPDLYVTLIGTASTLQVTDSPDTDRSPAWSPDGHFLAFMRYTASTCTLYIVPAIGGAERKVAGCGSNRMADLTWSPDGRWLALSGRATASGPHGILLVRPDTGERRQLTAPLLTTYGDFDPSFSPDGRHVAFTRMALDESFDLFTIPLEGGQETQLTFDERLIRGHAWRPGGEGLLFASNRRGRFGLWHVAARGGPIHWVPITLDNLINPSISPSAHRLVFQQDRRETNLWQVDLDVDASPRRAQPWMVSTGTDITPHVSPDGRHLAFASNRSGTFEIWVANRDGTAPVQLTNIGGAFTEAPRWSPDGTRIAFDSRPDGHADILVLDVDTRAVRRLSTHTADDWIPSWSNDGAWIYFGSDRSGTFQVWKVAADGGEPVQVTRRGGQMGMESPDGQYLYFARNDTSGIWRQPLGEGPAAPVLQDLAPVDWGSWVVATDGLYYVQRHTGSLAYFDFHTGETRQLLQPPQSVTWSLPSLALSPDQQHLFYTQADRQEGDIMMVESF